MEDYQSASISEHKEKGYRQVATPTEKYSYPNSSLLEQNSSSQSDIINPSSSRSGIFHVTCRHCHHQVSAAESKKARTRLLLASFLCVTFMLAETVGGILSNSLAILSDAAHLLADVSSFMVGLLALWLASRPPTRSMNFGYHRAEILGALVSILTIWLVTGILVKIAIERIVSNVYEIEGDIMVYIAVASLVFNVIMFMTLHGIPKNNSFVGYKSSPVEENSREVRENINVRAAILHVIGDFLQSLGVLIASLIIFYKPEYKIVDPICTFVFAILVLGSTINILIDVFRVLMEGTPRGIDFELIQTLLLEIPGVVKVFNLRVWALNLDKLALSAHIAISQEDNALAILQKATDAISKNIRVFEMTLQIEEYNESDPLCTVCDLTVNE